MNVRVLLCGALAAVLAGAAAGADPARAEQAIEVVELPIEDSPLVAVRLMFKVGSMHDPAGKEGLAALTGLMVAQAGSQRHTYREIVDALYPLAADITVSTDREVTVISGVTHREQLRRFTRVLLDVVLQPGFAEADLDRNRQQLLSVLTNTLRASSDERLGLEVIQQVIFADHPYGHAPEGTVQALRRLTRQDVEDFYRQHYTRANLLLGVGGGYHGATVNSLTEALQGLPEGRAAADPVPEPAAVQGRTFTLIEKQTGSVGIHLGYPLPVGRSHPDHYALMVANSHLGEHRTFHGRLMQQLRGKRGLNYGDYSYIEHWHSPPSTSHPSPGVPRRQQYFSVWIRPVTQQTAHFALRAAVYEVARLAQRGLSAEEFELTRDFLVNYSKLWAQSVSRQLGFKMDSRYYGTPDYIPEIERRLRALTLEQVNDALRRHLGIQQFHAVLVTADAARMKALLEQEAPSPMVYNSPPDAEVAEADAVIERLDIRPTSIHILPVEDVCER